ncbi:hypothetical protein BGZ65_000745 [Modicella reniformis]|uniref:Atos-like C-terminal domain-containing protein n=1 Tax=Modicella reniformis TaxID=1440133 RepID=A0A9P6INQ8_9FUNG|nr:hypothetical protein BGZ65_000745 [Modicella reniformis]
MSHNSGTSSLSHSQSLAHSLPTTQDDPILPYVGNLDLDSAFRGSRRFARMPGGMRIPLRGQVQVMIKNPNKTLVKVFLVPYDFMDMPAGTKTFLRQKYYSTGLGVGPVLSSSNNNNNNSTNGGRTLRYAIHLQFCSPAPGFVYLYRSIRVVFANRVPDGKESLRVVLEGLGLGSRTIENTRANPTPTTPVASAESGNATLPAPKKLEERYVKMRKGEVSFCSSKKKMDQSVVMDMSMDVDLLHSSSRGLGLGLDQDYSSPSHSHGLYETSSGYRCQPQLHFDGQLIQGNVQDGPSMNKRTLNPMGMEQHTSPFRLAPGSGRTGTSRLLDSSMDGVVEGFKKEDDEYKSIPSGVLIGHMAAGGSPKRGSSLDSSPLPTLYHSKESGYRYGSGALVHKEKSHILGI